MTELKCLLLRHNWLYYNKVKFTCHRFSMDMEPITIYDFSKRRCIRCERKEETNEGGLFGMRWRRVR